VAAQAVKLMAQKGIAVAGSRILVMGAPALRALGKQLHVLYDPKYALPARDSDLRL
jgi:UDP-N-acetyl-D-galactosamine dehydrogenase